MICENCKKEITYSWCTLFIDKKQIDFCSQECREEFAGEHKCVWKVSIEDDGEYGYNVLEIKCEKCGKDYFTIYSEDEISSWVEEIIIEKEKGNAIRELLSKVELI